MASKTEEPQDNEEPNVSEEEEEEDQGLRQVIVLNDDGMEATEDKIKEESNLLEIEETLQGSAIFVPHSIIKPEEQQEHEEGIQEDATDQLQQSSGGENEESGAQNGDTHDTELDGTEKGKQENDDEEEGGGGSGENQETEKAATDNNKQDPDTEDLEVVIAGPSTTAIWQRNRFTYNKNEAVPIATRGEDGDIPVMLGETGDDNEQTEQKEPEQEIMPTQQQNPEFGPNIRIIDEKMEKRGPTKRADGTWVSSIGIELPKDPKLPPDDKKVIFDYDPEDFEDKQWRKAGADISEWFNFGLNEQTWRIYCRQQRLLRKQMRTAQLLDAQGSQHQ